MRANESRRRTSITMRASIDFNSICSVLASKLQNIDDIKNNITESMANLDPDQYELFDGQSLISLTLLMAEMRKDENYKSMLLNQINRTLKILLNVGN